MFVQRKDRPLDMARTRCNSDVVRFLTDQIMEKGMYYNYFIYNLWHDTKDA